MVHQSLKPAAATGAANPPQAHHSSPIFSYAELIKNKAPISQQQAQAPTLAQSINMYQLLKTQQHTAGPAGNIAAPPNPMTWGNIAAPQPH